MLQFSIEIVSSLGKQTCWKGSYRFLCCIASCESEEIISSNSLQSFNTTYTNCGRLGTMVAGKIFCNLLHLSIWIMDNIGKQICLEVENRFLSCLSSTESKEIISSYLLQSFTIKRTRFGSLVTTVAENSAFILLLLFMSIVLRTRKQICWKGADRFLCCLY